MKNLNVAKQMLGIIIRRDRSKRKLHLSHEKYNQEVIQQFHVSKANRVSIPLASHFKLSTNQCPIIYKEKEEMKTTPYALVVVSLMYAIVCIKSDLAYAIGMVSCFLSLNLVKKH